MAAGRASLPGHILVSPPGHLGGDMPGRGGAERVAGHSYMYSFVTVCVYCIPPSTDGGEVLVVKAGMVVLVPPTVAVVAAS